MAFQEVEGLDCDLTTAVGGINKKTGKANPKSVSGYYLGKRTVDSEKSTTGKANIYVLQTPEGTLGVWGKTDLDRRMAAAQVGVMTRITHTGYKESKYGQMYIYKVELDRDDTTDTSLLVGAYNLEVSKVTTNEPEDYAVAADDSGDDVSDEPTIVATSFPKKPAKSADALKQARLQALLNSNNK